jgi:ABC-2 type transport system permease protein
MSLPLFIKDIKNNSILLIVFAVLMSIYLSVIIFMYDPNGIGALFDMLSVLPSVFVKGLGLDSISDGLIGFIGSLYYGFLIYLFPMVYCIILGNRLVAKFVDDGFFAYLLSTPNSRIKLIVTQGVYLLFSILLLFLIVFFVGIGVSNRLFPGLLDIGIFIKLNMNACLLTMAIGMICFFFSCLFNKTKWSLLFGAIIPIMFFSFTLLSGFSDRFGYLKSFSLYSLFNGIEIVNGSANISNNPIIYSIIILCLFAGSIGVFQFKRLPI